MSPAQGILRHTVHRVEKEDIFERTESNRKTNPNVIGYTDSKRNVTFEIKGTESNSNEMPERKKTLGPNGKETLDQKGNRYVNEFLIIIRPLSRFLYDFLGSVSSSVE